MSHLRSFGDFGGVMSGDRAAWTRVNGADGPLDLLDARFRRRHYAPYAHEEFAFGCADQAHLTRWFRRVVGVTPGAYRNSVQDSARRRR